MNLSRSRIKDVARRLLPARWHAPAGRLLRAVRGGGLADRAAQPVLQRRLRRVDEASAPWLRAGVADAFERLWDPQHQPVAPPEPAVREVIERQMNRLYYHVSDRTWKDTWYRGTRLYKCPTDMWVYQEIIDELRPGLVVETGTFRGGSALFIADRLELQGHGEVVTVDITALPDQPQHPRLSYLLASSTAPDLLAEIDRRLPTDGSPVVVILDSDHSRQHVLDELRAFAPVVTPGSYLIVEDTNVNGHPVAPTHGPGPWEAVEQFLAETDEFEIDPRGERYFLTQNPSGFLRRRTDTARPATADREIAAPQQAVASGDPAETANRIVADMEMTAPTPSVVLVLPGLGAGQAFAGVRTAVVAGASTTGPICGWSPTGPRPWPSPIASEPAWSTPIASST